MTVIKSAAKKVAYTIGLSHLLHEDHNLPNNIVFALVGILRNENMLKPFTALEIIKISREASKFEPTLESEIERLMDFVISTEIDGNTSFMMVNINNQFIPALCSILSVIEENDKEKYDYKYHLKTRLELNRFVIGRGGLHTIIDIFNRNDLFDMVKTSDTVMTRILAFKHEFKKAS